MTTIERQLLRAVVSAAANLLLAPPHRIAVARAELLDALAEVADVLDLPAITDGDAANHHRGVDP